MFGCKQALLAILLVGDLLVASASLRAQSIDNNPGTVNLQQYTVYYTAPNTGVLVFAVFAEKVAPLDRQALLKLVNLKDQTVNWQTTKEESKGAVGAFTNLAYGSYSVEISAVGYLSEHKEVSVANSKLQQFEIVLHRDPAAINLDVSDRAIPKKARKETKSGVAALKSRRYQDAQKHLDIAYKLDPTSAELNFLLGYLFFQKNDFEQASKYLQTATKLSPQHAQALTLLGRASLEQKDYSAAQSAFERAIAIDGEPWLPHNLLADTYFREKNYKKAREEAETALAKGKAEASAARLVLGESLINLGLDQQGLEALETFLRESPRHPMAGMVRGLIAEVRDYETHAATAQTERSTGLRLSGVDPLLALEAPGLTVKSWQPPSLDDLKLALASDVTCPAENVIEETGKHVAELADDVARFVAIEDLFHQSLDNFGNPIRSETRKYNYAASISEPEPGFLAVDESRADKMELEGYPDKIASTGFVALALVFHPHMRDEFNLTCEGLGDWHGQPSWVVYFKQRDDKPNRIQSYKVGKMVYPVKLKGRAWITADKFQIVHMESEMVRPMPEITLASEHQVVDYGPIRFEKKNTSLWLPKSAEIYFDFRHHKYYRRHSFDHYMLFAVDVDEKRKEPANPPADNPDTGEGKKS